jgi:hypothetical protein
MSKWKEHRDEGHRTLGRYVAEFSQLIREMRERMQQRFRRPGDPPLLADLLFAGATAEPIATTFFAMCRMLKEHDTNEAKAATRLRVLVTEEITLRNDIAHGDWYIGYTSSTGLPDGTTTPQPVPAWVDRIKAGRKEGPLSSITEDLDVRSDEVQQLTKIVREYGKVCFGVHGRQGAGQDLRVGDVLLLVDGEAALGPLADR